MITLELVSTQSIVEGEYRYYRESSPLNSPIITVREYPDHTLLEVFRRGHGISGESVIGSVLKKTREACVTALNESGLIEETVRFQEEQLDLVLDI